MPTVQPLRCEGDLPVATQVQLYLRRLVLSGTLEPGLEFSQVELARDLGVSRTPLREALRMLQEEGLVEAEPNRKARVADCKPAELDAVYACRVGLESVAVGMTALTRSSEVLAELDGLLTEMERLGGEADVDAFEVEHRRFHQLLVVGAPPMFVQVVHGNQDRAERYWRCSTPPNPVRTSDATASTARSSRQFGRRTRRPPRRAWRGTWPGPPSHSSPTWLRSRTAPPPARRCAPTPSP
jgi:DNA-binding GntR family transcriptional regulator